MSKEKISLIPVYKYLIVSQFEEPAFLPPYKGSTLRGAFGLNFKNMVCVNRKVAQCSSCFIAPNCVYKLLFESEYLRKDGKVDIPSPFLIEPPYENKRFYERGEEFRFNCLIFGKAVEYFPYFVLTFKKIGENGIGLRAKRGRFKLVKIKNINNRIIYHQRGEILKDFRKPVRIKIPKITTNILRVRFVSPTRIKLGGKLINNLPFNLFMKTILRRISLLKKFYSEESQNWDYKALLEKSNFVSTVRSSLRWYDWQRFSFRQKAMMKLGGFVGEIVYQGEIKEFLPFIKLGEIIHIGKNCSFGLGKYEIVEQ